MIQKATSIRLVYDVFYKRIIRTHLNFLLSGSHLLSAILLLRSLFVRNELKSARKFQHLAKKKTLQNTLSTVVVRPGEKGSNVISEHKPPHR